MIKIQYSMCLIALFFSLTISNRCFSAVSNIMGMGIRNMSLSGAANITDPGSYAAKENPATLTNADKSLFSIGFTDNILSLKNTDSYRSKAAPSGISYDDYKASAQNNLQHINFGFSLPIGNYFAFGISGLIPSRDLANIYAFTGNESNYLLYSDRQQTPEIFTAVALKLPGDFSIGAGVFYSLKADGNIQLALSSTDADTRTIVNLNPVYLPYAGISFKKEIFTSKYLLLGVIYRDKHSSHNKFDVDTNLKTDFSSIQFETSSSLNLMYDPAVLGFGAGVDVKKYSIHGSFQINFWSKYKPPIIHLSGSAIDDIVDPDAEEIYGEIKLNDTYSYKLGTIIKDILKFKNFFTDLRFGAEYHTSALPKSPVNLAVVDTPRTALSIGTALKIPKEYSNKPLLLELGCKYSHLKTQKLTVVQNGAVTQSASVGGNIITLMGGISVNF